MLRSNLRNSLTRHFAIVAALFVATACQSPVSPSSSSITPDAAQFAASSVKVGTHIAISAPDVAFGQAANITVQLYTDHALGGKKVSITIDGAAAITAVTARVGTVTFTVNGLSAGSHSVVAQFAGDNGYTASSASASFSVVAP